MDSWVWVFKDGKPDPNDIKANTDACPRGAKVISKGKDQSLHVSYLAENPGKDTRADLETLVEPSNYEPMDERSIEGVRDMSQLLRLSQGSMLHNLHTRYVKDLVYTVNSSVLVVINPFRLLGVEEFGEEGIYGSDFIQRYRPKVVRSNLVSLAVAVQSQKNLLAVEASKSQLPMVSPRAVTPEMKSPPLVTPDDMPGDDAKPSYEGAPHIFGVACKAYTQMLENRRNQSIVISGESGAGKTETTKHVLKFLAAVSSSATLERLPREDSDSHQLRKGSWMKRMKKDLRLTVEAKISCTNPILEAFGCATTLRNDNSSRFGKYISVQFDTRGHIVGALINKYLLEKSRVVYQGPEERNFHIFYHLLAGGDAQLKKELELGKAEDFHYVNQGNMPEVRRGGVLKIDDAELFKDVIRSMRMLQFPDGTDRWIMRVVAALLHLGNVSFGERGGKVFVDQRGEKFVGTVARLLEVDKERLRHSLTMTTMKIGGGAAIPKEFDLCQAQEARDTLAKNIYEALFEHIVVLINRTLDATNGTQHKVAWKIGVLDVFGFENFVRKRKKGARSSASDGQNSFEQLCINFANEKLQKHYNDHMFKKEQAMYEEEGIHVEKTEWNDNEHVLDLIDHDRKKCQDPAKKGLKDGIIALLTDQCKLLQNAEDSKFLFNVMANHKGSKVFGVNKLNPRAFSVAHYADTIEYEVSDEKSSKELPWVKKNLNAMTSLMLDVVCESKSAFFSSLFIEQRKAAIESEKTHGKAPETVASTFSDQLHELVDNQLSVDVDPSFIRCIKPSESKEPHIFSLPMVRRQLLYSGLMEAVKLRQAGFPIRMEPRKFIVAYCAIRPLFLDELDAPSERLKELAITLISAVIPPDPKRWQMGRTMLFMKDEVYFKLEQAREQHLTKHALLIQRRYRSFLAMKWWEQASTIYGPAIKRVLRCAVAKETRIRLKKNHERKMAEERNRRVKLLVAGGMNEIDAQRAETERPGLITWLQSHGECISDDALWDEVVACKGDYERKRKEKEEMSHLLVEAADLGMPVPTGKTLANVRDAVEDFKRKKREQEELERLESDRRMKEEAERIKREAEAAEQRRKEEEERRIEKRKREERRLEEERKKAEADRQFQEEQQRIRKEEELKTRLEAQRKARAKVEEAYRLDERQKELALEQMRLDAIESMLMAPKKVSDSLLGKSIVFRGIKGVVQYVGSIFDNSGEWVGVELEKSMLGAKDGMVGQRRLFLTKPECAVFMRREVAVKLMQ